MYSIRPKLLCIFVNILIVSMEVLNLNELDA
jgi:hypothetical protein